MRNTAITATAIALALVGAIRRIASDSQPTVIEWSLVGRIVGITLIVLMVAAIIAVGVAEEIQRRR